MADIKNNLHLVYSALKNEGYTDIGDEQDFIKKMQDEQNRLKVYNALKGAGYNDMGSDFKSFSGMIYTAPSEKPQQTVQQSSATPTIQTNVVTPVAATPKASDVTPAPKVQRGDGSMLLAENAKPKESVAMTKPWTFTSESFHTVPFLKKDKNGNPIVEGATGGTFNAATGQMEGATGGYYTDWTGKKIPIDSDYGKAAAAYGEHIKNMNPVDAELQEAYKERDRINKMLSERMGEIDKTEDDLPWYARFMHESGRAVAGDKMGGAGSTTDYQLKYNNDQQYRNIMSAARKNKAAIAALEDKKNGMQNEFWHSFGNTIMNGYTFSQGDSDWGDINALVDAKKHLPELERKMQTGEKLTKDEEVAATVIKNHAWDNDVQQRYGDEYGAWSRAGETAVGSLELGIDFLTMGPELKATAGSVMKITEKGAQKMLGEMATKGLGKYMTKATGVTVGSMVAGAQMSNTVGINRTTSDVGKRYLGQVTVNDEDGSYQFDGGKSFLQSLYEAEAAAAIENGSEVLGEFLPGSGMLLKGLEKVGMKKVANGLTRLGGSTWYKNYTKALESIGFHGVGGEAVEEYAGLLGNALLVGDNKFSDLLDPKTHIDIWLGCAVTGGLLNAPRTIGYAAEGAQKGYQAAQYYRYKHKTDKADAAADAVWGDEWSDMRDRIDGTSNEDMTDIATSIYTDADMTPEQKRTALDYIGNLTAMRGYNMGRISMEREDENGRGTSDEERSLNNAYATGYNSTEQSDMEDAKNAYDMHRKLAEENLDGWTLSALDGNETSSIDGEPFKPLDILANMNPEYELNGERITDEQRKIAADYLNAKARYEGMIQRVRDDIDSRISASDAAIDQRTNRVGYIQPATMKLDDRKVYVVDGNLVMNEDGSMIDTDNSSESLLVRDAETGQLEWASPHDFISVDEQIDPAYEKEVAQQAIREQYAEEQAQKIDGILPFNMGDIYSVMEEDGTQWTAQILADNGDGTVQVAWNGNVNNPQTVNKDFLQELSNNAAMARLAQSEQERIIIQEQEKEDEFQNNRPVYNLNDEVTLRGENGEPVRGSITAEENEDGEIEVYTEDPINGKKIHMFTRQQIDDMLLQQNGEDVVVPEAPSSVREIEAAEAVQTEPTTVPNVGETVPETTETVQNNAESVQNNAESVQSAKESATVEPMPMVGEGEDAEPDFAKVSPERAHNYIFNESGLGEEDANTFVQNNVRASGKALDKVKDKKPKMGTSIAKFNKDKAEWERKVQEAEQTADYWKQVKAERDRVLAERMEERRQREAEEAAKAQAEQAAYEAEQLRKAEEQAALGASNVSPAIVEKWQNAPKVEGAQDEIVLPNGEKVAGRYYLVESGAASASHDSNNGFAKTEGFPVDENGGSVNDRDYERDMDAQQITRDIANNYDSRAVQTPVFVSQDGVVLSGNGRTMAGELAASQNTDGAYNSHIAQYPTKWGFTQQQVEGMQHPRVVFVPDAAMPYTAETFAKFNQQEMKGQSKTEQAVKLGKVVSDGAFNRIIGIINHFDTLGDFYADNKATSEAIGELQKDGAISSAQMAEMYDGEGISAVGKEILENTLIGKAFESNPDAVREITEFKSMRQSIITALAEISNNLSLGKDYSLESELAQAIDLVYQARQHSYKAGERVSGFARQQNLFAFEMGATVADYTNATVLMLADTINDNRITQLKKVLQVYNHQAQDAANGQLDLFSGDVREKKEILNDVKQLIYNGTEAEQQKAAEDAIEKRKAESVQQDGTVGNGGEGTRAEEQGGKQQGNLEKTEGVKLSDEIDENGKQFVLTSNGELSFGYIGEETGLTPAPILLSEGVITDPNTNAGYGLVHIEARHGEQIRKAGYKSVIEFVEEVAKNYEVIREGKDRNGNTTYLLQLTDKHDNTLIVELSDDATYWNINTAGIFKSSYGAKKKEVYNRHTTENQSAETDARSLDEEQGGTPSSTSMLSPTPDVSVAREQSEGKGTDNSGNTQENPQKNAETAENSVLSHDRMVEIVRQDLIDCDGFVELIDFMTDEELEHYIELMDAWETVNDEYGRVMQEEEKNIRSKDKTVSDNAKAKVRAAEQAANSAFMPVQDYYHDLVDKYNVDGENVRENVERQRAQEAIAEAEAEVEQNPTDAQKEAGNYKKGHVKVDGYDITIENPKGGTRSGKDADGKEWSITMNNTYGYIRGTEGVDGDHIDVFLSDDPTQGNVYVIDQRNADGTFDEHKVMYGFSSAEEARANYLANYEEGWSGLGTITEVTKDEFKKWIDSSHRKTKPFADYKSVKVESAQNESAEGVVTSAAEKPKGRKSAKPRNPKDADFKTIGNTGDVYANSDGYIEILRIDYDRTHVRVLDDNKEYVGSKTFDTVELADMISNGEYQKVTAVAPAETIAEETSKDGYSVSPAKYTTKAGKVLDMHLVKFDNDLSNQQKKAASKLARSLKGWWSKEDGGFMLRNADDAEQLADLIMNDEDAVSDSQPVSLADVQSVADTEENTSGAVAESEEEQMRKENLNVGDRIIYQGKMYPIVGINTDFGDRRYEIPTSSDGTQVVMPNDVTPAFVFHSEDISAVDNTATANTVAPKASEQDTTEKTESEPKRLVSDERMAELAARLRKKIGGQMNVGVDPEILAIGAELAVGHIERGVTKFADYAKVMIDNIGDVIRPYLKSFYNAVRDMPEAEEYADQMDSYEDVRKFNVAEIGNESVDAFATAEQVVNEQQAEQQTNEVKEQIIETRNRNRHEEDEKTTSDTAAIAEEAETVASETESVISSGDTAAIAEHVSKIDEAVDKVNKQLALLGYYEADTDDASKFHESYGYMKTAEKKAVADAENLARAISSSLGVNLGRKKVAKANIAPIGGDVTFRIPLNESNELFFDIMLDKDMSSDNLVFSRALYRLEDPREGHSYRGQNFFIEPNAKLDDILAKVKNIVETRVKGFEIKPLTSTEKVKEPKTTENKPKSKKKAVSLQQPSLFGDLFADIEMPAAPNATAQNTESNETTNVQPGTAEERGTGHRPQQDAEVGGSTGNEAERTDGRGMGGGNSRNPMSDKGGSERLSGTPQSQQHVETPAANATETEVNTSGTVAVKPEGETSGTVAKNTNNNHAERGKDYAPKGVDARIDANIKAIELMQQLMESGKQATPAQMKVLRQYSGWGGLGKAFGNLTSVYGEQTTAGRLRELLGEEGYEQAQLSRNTAFYTPAYIIDTMWDIARAFGFKGGKVLEGSAGIGNIIGAMPTDMSERSDIQAVELDETTGNILTLLYPDANVEVQGFEATNVPNGSVDLAITNVPFGDIRVKDITGDKDLSKKFHAIHDFCIAKNVRKLREGGIGIFISTSGTLDNSTKLRQWVVGDGNADFVGAFRLNNKSFGGAAVTSDIIVVRKRVNGKKSPNAIDVSSVISERSAQYEDKDARGNDVTKTLAMDYNKYFVEHPEKMGGVMKFGFEANDTYRPTSRGLYPIKDKSQDAMLAEWAKSFEDMKEETQSNSVEQSGEPIGTVYEDLGKDVKEGSMLIDNNGVLCIAQFGKAVPLAVNANKVKGHTKAECFKSYAGIKSALADVLSYQTENEGDEGLKPLLAKLNKAYDDFIKTYGHLHKNTSISFLKNDVDFSNILALETFSEIGDVSGKRVKEYGKTDIFNQRVVEKEKEPEPKNVKDGIIASIYQFGRIDVPYIASKLDIDADAVRQEIIASGLGFENPQTLQMDVVYEYLSGNVREKLQQAEEANIDGKYSANVEALRKVIPMDIPAHLIEFSLGSSWVDKKLYEDYIKERTDVDVTLTSAGGTWLMKSPTWIANEKNKAMGVRSEELNKWVYGSDLIEAALQNKTITVSTTRSVGYGSNKTTETITDKVATQACAAKIDEIRSDFKDWARERMKSDDAMSAKMERIYNEQFNNYVPKSIPDEFVPKYFGGANHKFQMRPHQGKAIIRGTMQPLLLAHEVGTGKTFTLISTAMEMRRLGTARKPMIVVQNATVGQFVASAKELYPNAKVLTLEDKDHTGEGRKNFYAKIKYNDWDMIVVPQSVFERIPDSEERQMEFIKDKIDEKIATLDKIREADESGSITRQAEKELQQLEEQLNALGAVSAEKRKKRDEKKEAVTRQNAEVKAMEMLDRATDDVENFDDMGIDAILVDEAHEYKHLGFATAMQRGVKGIDPSYSKKAQGVYLKTQAVLEKNNGRNVVFATGTPISNTAAEIWTFMRYLMTADSMKEYGIYYFDDFVRNFGSLQQMPEFTTSGKFKEVNRFAGYINLPELVRIWSGVADTVLTREAGGVSDKIPDMEGAKAQDIYLPQTKALRRVMKFVKEELEAYDKMSGKDKKANSHIPLTMYGIAKAAAVDARLVMEDAEDNPMSKTNEAVRQTLRSLEETKDYKGTVALFADNYQNKHTGFNLYEDIREKLIQQGVPAEQIVVMKSGMTVKKKLEIFDKVNSGEVRVIMGSTFTLGTGVNIQERLHTLIHLDAPNRPMDYTQRNGRILRQGNLHKQMNKPVRVLRFGVEDSLDVTAYQRLKTKGAIADSIMNGKQMMQNSMEDRVMEEEEDVFGDTVAQLSGSEYAMLKNQAERDVRKYEAKRKQWEADQTYVHNAIPRISEQIESEERNAKINREYAAKLESLFHGEKNPPIGIGKKRFAGIEEMEDFFTDQNKKIQEDSDRMKENPAPELQETRTVDVKIGDATFTIKTTLRKEQERVGMGIVTKVRRGVTYTCEDLGMKDVPAAGGRFKNAIDDILSSVIDGRKLNESVALSEAKAKRLQGELEQVKSREGQPFQYEEELQKAYEHLEEYTELMKQELEEKGKKYAEMDSEVEAANNLTSAEEADEETSDEDNGIRYRESVPETSTDDKDLRFSLREEPKPKNIKTAYAVFVVKEHADGSVSLHPKMLADEAVGAPPHTWLNADTGTIKRDKEGNPIQNTKGRVSVRDAKGAPLAWRPGKHLAAYPNASQFVSKKSGKIGSDVVFFEVEYAADRDYQLEAWEYGVNANGKYEHSQAGLPYIPKDGYYIYRTNVNPKIPAMIITGAYRIKRALNDAEAKALNQQAGGEWFDREGEPMTDDRLQSLGLDDAGMQDKAREFDYDELESPHDESAVAMSMPGYVRRELNFNDPNLLKAIRENGQDASYYEQMYEQQKSDERQREQTMFEDGQVLPIHKEGGRWSDEPVSYRVEGLNAEYRSKEALLDAFRNKHEGYISTLTEDGNGIEVNTWRPSKSSATGAKARSLAKHVERKTRNAIRMAEDIAKKLGLNIEVKTDTEGLTGRRARAKGWFDTKTGKIVVVLQNHTSIGDVMKTILHEGVAHYGLRELFGKDFDTFLDNVYANATEDIRKEINRLATKHGWDIRVATEEYLAGLAEDTDFENPMMQSWWHKIKNAFIELLRKVGAFTNFALTDADLRYILWRSYDNLERMNENGILRNAEDVVMQQKLGVRAFENPVEPEANTSGTMAAETDMRYRDGDAMDERDHAIVRDRYERTISSGLYQFREAVQDSMLSLRRLMEHIVKATGEKVKDFENAYMAENALSSKNHAEQDLYGKLLFNPLLDEMHRLAKEGSSRDEVTRYMMAKHGLERNEVMAARAAKKAFESEDNKDATGNPIKSEADFLAEYREKDFGGITGLMEESDLSIAEGLAQQFVNDFENNHDTTELWARTNACTKATLEKTYKTGLLNKVAYDEIKDMYEYYIPLRGFDATTSDEVYSYLTSERSGFSSPLKTAKGRKSVADDPIATIANMADSAIVQGNRNMMKQKFLKFVMNHPSDAVSVNRMWLRYDDVTDMWEAVTAQIDENDTPDVVLQKTEQFEEQMQQLAASDPDHYKRGKDAANLPYKTLGKNLNEHQVHVKMGGEDYILTINGNPRVSQALNGLTNPDNENTGAVGAILKLGEYVNRQMSAFYTTRNPEFVLSNFLRDALYANSTMWVRERPNYAVKFNKNFLKVNPAVLYGLIKKHNAGQLDMSNPMEQAFYQFMMNGGETGYTVVKDIDKQKKLIKKYLRGKGATLPVETAWQLFGDKLDEINRSVENCARFAAFYTSRQMGRSIERSVFDAKEVSVNFNKKGAGSTFMGKTGQTKLGNVGAFASGLGRFFYVFWNAAVQGTTNFASLHKHHTGKALAMDAALFLLGAVVSGLGGGDDDDYWNLPPYVRRSNICFKIPFTDSFVSIPLGIEQRAIYGLGELFSSVASGRERMSGKEIAKEIAGSLSSLLPLDLMESNGDISWSTVSPSYVKPFVETANNKDWKGMPIYRDTPYNKEDPEWTKASKRTNQYLVDFSKWCNEVTGGDEVKKGWLNFNPSKIEHVFEGVLGGVSTTANKLLKMGETVTGKQDFDWSNILMASRVVKNADEEAEAKRINAEYWKYYGEYKETKRLVDHYEDQESEGILGAAEKLDFMYNSPEYGRYEIVDDFYSDVKDLTDELNETTNKEERKSLESEINQLKMEMVKQIRAFDDSRK